MLGTDPVGSFSVGVLSADSSGVTLAPTGAFTDPTIDGQNVTINFTTANTPTSGTVTITAVSGGAVSQGPTAATLGSGTGSAAFTAVPGTYSYSGTLTNAGGSNAITNTGQFTILGVGNGSGGGEVVADSGISIKSGLHSRRNRRHTGTQTRRM